MYHLRMQVSVVTYPSEFDAFAVSMQRLAKDSFKFDATRISFFRSQQT